METQRNRPKYFYVKSHEKWTVVEGYQRVAVVKRDQGVWSKYGKRGEL